MSDPELRAAVGWVLMVVGIWHPYVVGVSPASASAIGTILGIAGMFIAMGVWDL